MESRTSYMPSSRQSRMAIDSLLNPSDNNDTRHTFSTHHYSSYPSSPNRYYYTQYPENPGSSISSHDQNHNQNQTQSQIFLTYRPRSTESLSSSPGPGPGSDPYSRDRYDSVSSSSSTNAPERRRPPRPKYEEEEMYFIWYHRVDLCQEWKEVRESFNRQFPSRQRRGFQGIQCKFYRFIKEKKCPTLREQRRLRDGDFLREPAGRVEADAPRFGVVDWARVWYPWMREDKEEVLSRRLSA